MRILWTAIVGVALTFSWGPAWSWGYPRKLPDQVIETSFGELQITKLTNDQAVGSVMLRGRITNNTSKDWDGLTLALDLSDKSGPIVVEQISNLDEIASAHQPSGLVQIEHLGVGQSTGFSYVKPAQTDKSTLTVAFSLYEAPHPANYTIALLKPAPSTDLTFHADAISLQFSLQLTSLQFILKNDGDDPVTIDWNKVAFVDPSGNSQAVIHQGVKLADRSAVKAPTVIPPHSKITDEVLPVGNVDFVNGEWNTKPLLPTGQEGLGLVGSQFVVFLPLQVGEKTKSYSFTFKILAAK